MAAEDQACLEALCQEAPPSPSGGVAEDLLAAVSEYEAHRRRGRRVAMVGLVLMALSAAAVVFAGHEGVAAVRRVVTGPEVLGLAAQPAAGFQSRPPLTFYVYRAGGQSSYPLENVNAADLAGVMWYLHNEVIVSTPRKYAIDRIRRFKLTMKTTQEFWNVHHRNFGAFVAFDAAKCTTPICPQIFSQYGFIIGCQVLPIDVLPYLGDYQTQVNGACQGEDCNAPVWYSLPGDCPTEGFSNQQIKGNSGTQDVLMAKSPECLKNFPGGRCDSVTGAPDCTFHSEEAGEIMLDELAGIDNYDHFWNTSFVECSRDVKAGLRTGPCRHNKEFDVDEDAGIGCSFWDGKADRANARQRMKAVRDLFKKHYPDMPYDLEEPACDFDMYYDGEMNWPINHTGAVAPQRGYNWEKGMDMRITTTTTRAPGAGPAPMTCTHIGCGNRGTHCDCNPACHKYNDCCEDYADFCHADGHSSSHKATEHHHTESHGDDELTSQLSPACFKKHQACEKAAHWAKEHGVYEHKTWYKGLTSKSSITEFQQSLAETKHGNCNELCRDDVDALLVMKRV